MVSLLRAQRFQAPGDLSIVRIKRHFFGVGAQIIPREYGLFAVPKPAALVNELVEAKQLSFTLTRPLPSTTSGYEGTRF